MRAINTFIFGNFFLLFALKIYEFNDNNVNNITRTLNLALTPTIFFFNFLDYTDSASLAFITMAFYYCLVGSVWRMGICSLFSVYMRQNNIVWCGYLLLYRIVTTYSVSICAIRGNILRLTVSFIRLILVNSKKIIYSNFVQILIFPIFIWYLHQFNSGKLVFGDHENHQVSFHPAQLLYLFLFITVNLPITLNDYIYMGKNSFIGMYFSRHAFAAYLFLVSASIIIIDKFSYVHPFILSDNRHYIFYIYRYFKWAKYPLCLVYPFCIISNIKLIVNSN
jgi:alpha-1,2-glucosyltransferase